MITKVHLRWILRNGSNNFYTALKVLVLDLVVGDILSNRCLDVFMLSWIAFSPFEGRWRKDHKRHREFTRVVVWDADRTALAPFQTLFRMDNIPNNTCISNVRVSEQVSLKFSGSDLETSDLHDFLKGKRCLVLLTSEGA
jgi:hypothetical protein